MTSLEEAQTYLDAYQTSSLEEKTSLWRSLSKEAKAEVRRLDRLKYVVPENATSNPREEISPSGQYKLVITSFETRGDGWDYTQGLVYRRGSDEPIANVCRNYSAFPFLWVEGHAKGDFLVCGEDYQGQTVIDLTTGRRRDHLPEEANEGHGFCWASYTYDAEHEVLFVDGCYWACPYEWRAYDFSDPMGKGWPQLETFDEKGEQVSMEVSHKAPAFVEGSIVFYETKSFEDYESDYGEVCEKDYDFMAEAVWEGEGEDRYAVVARPSYRREGDKLLLQTYWVHDLEKLYRKYREDLRKEYEAYVAHFKANDPLYLAFVEGCKDPALSPESHVWRGFTHEKWCSEWQGQESRWGKDIVTKGPLKVTLEWAEKTGPVLLTSVKDGKTTTEVFLEHSVESIQAAFARTKELIGAE